MLVLGALSNDFTHTPRIRQRERKKIVGNVEQDCLCAYASHVGIRSILVSGKLPTYPPPPF